MRNRENYNEYMRKYMSEKYRRQRLRILRVLGRKCVQCGSCKSLEVDHIDNNSKEHNVSRIWNTKIVVDEIDKCQLLCKSCHTLKSIKERGHKVAKGKHGTISSYRYCKCDKCRKAKSDAYYAWKLKSK